MTATPVSRQTSIAPLTLLRASLATATLLAFASAVLAQPTFSVDFHGPPIGALDSCTGFPITEGDILSAPPPGGPAPGPLPAPCIVSGATFGIAPVLGLCPAAVFLPPLAPGVDNDVEVDALSYGLDGPLSPGMATGTVLWYFSVDEFSVGVLVPAIPAPCVTTEGSGPIGAGEASADVFVELDVGSGPIPAPVFAPVFGANLDVIDGNGVAPFGGSGLGLAEPHPPVPGLPDLGANLDALDIDTPPGTFPIYFSLEGGFVNPDEGVPNSGSAAANGVVGGDVLVSYGAPPVASPPCIPPTVYAPAPALGLDVMGTGTDDLDALILWENGDGFFTPAPFPYAWLDPADTGAIAAAVFGPTDMLFFSVRPGSAVIDMPDSLSGLPIKPGDILTPPFVGGFSPFPAIWIPQENLGLFTDRTPGAYSDNVDALDLVVDCNANGSSDLTDILSGLSLDCNANLIPDECDLASGTSIDADGDGVPDECEIPLFQRGNADSVLPVEITDGIFIIGFLFLGGVAPSCLEAADANNDGSLNLSDGIMLFNFLFLGGPMPPAPGPFFCGPDPDLPGGPGDLGCADYDGC